MNAILINILGIAAILLTAFILSSGKRNIKIRIVGAAFALQVVIAALVLRSDTGRYIIETMASAVSNLLGYANEGTKLIFGNLASPELGGSSFALSALTVIIFFASVVSILYYLKIMQFIIKWVGGAIQKITGISKVESLGAAANIFVGQSESPLVIRPYLESLKPSQLFTIMVVGMAGVAGTILAAYASFLGEQAIPYLLAAAFMSAPGGILMAKIIMPDEGDISEPDIKPVDSQEEPPPANLIMAASQGAQTGVKLAAAVGAMVLAFVALVALANGLLSGVAEIFGYGDVTFQGLFGYVFAPIMYLIGIPWEEASLAGLNEFVAFITLGEQAANLSARSYAIITFALCGFANFSSIAIQMAVTGGLAPSQRPIIAKLGLKALAAGSLANLMSAALAGLLLPL